MQPTDLGNPDIRGKKGVVTLSLQPGGREDECWCPLLGPRSYRVIDWHHIEGGSFNSNWKLLHEQIQKFNSSLSLDPIKFKFSINDHSNFCCNDK